MVHACTVNTLQDLHRLWDEYSQLHGDLEVYKSEAKAGAEKRRGQLKRKINQLEQVCRNLNA